MADTNFILESNKKILDCIFDICDCYLPNYDTIDSYQDFETLFVQIIKKYFDLKDSFKYKGRVQMIHDNKSYLDNKCFYNILLDDFKLYIYNIINNINLKTSPDYNILKRVFDTNISFIHYYNFIIFLINISNQFPQIIYEDKYKLDLLMIIAIFSPDYEPSFEKGVTDKYGINYESYTILKLELIDLIKEKKYDGYNDNIDFFEIEKCEFKYPKKWENIMSQMEEDIIGLFLFNKFIYLYLYEKRCKCIKDIEYLDGQKFNIFKKFLINPELNIQYVNKIISNIKNSIITCKSINDKKKFVENIKNNLITNNDYKLLNDYGILINLDILLQLYSLQQNELFLHIIYFSDILQNQNQLNEFKPKTFFDFIKNRSLIIEDLRKANNYENEFKKILADKKFRERIRKIMNSNLIKKYYEEPKYYADETFETIKTIDQTNFIDIYNRFYKVYIESDKIYEMIVIKRMPYGVKGSITPYLNFILDPYGFEMKNNICEKEKYKYIENYLIILFLQETNLFSKRSNFLNKPLSISKTPKHYKGGESIIKYIFGIKHINIINDKLCKILDNNDFWATENPEQFYETIINNLKVENESKIFEELIKIKNEQNCLITFSNYRKPKSDKSKSTFTKYMSKGCLICC